MSLSERVKQLRREKGWTQKELAEKIDRKQNTISYIEKGGGAEMDTLRALADIFDVNPNYLVEDDVAITPRVLPEVDDNDHINHDVTSNIDDIKKTDEYEFVLNIIKAALDNISNPEELDDKKMAYFKALFKQAIENKANKNSTND